MSELERFCTEAMAKLPPERQFRRGESIAAYMVRMTILGEQEADAFRCKYVKGFA